MRRAGIVNANNHLDITQQISAQQFHVLGLHCGISTEKARQLLVGEDRQIGFPGIFTLHGDFYPDSAIQTINPNTLLAYEANVPFRVPTNLFGAWKFIYPDRREEIVASGQFLTEAQRALVKDPASRLVHRETPELIFERSDINITFEAAKNNLSQHNPIPSLARFMFYLETHLSAHISRAFLIGSYGWGSSTHASDDVDLVIIFNDNVNLLEVQSLENKYWKPYENKPLALYIYTHQDWLAAQALKKLLTAERNIDTFGNRGMQLVAGLPGFSPEQKMLAWFHSNVTLIEPGKRNIIEEYRQKMYLLELQARKGSLQALEELYELNHEHPGMISLAVSLAKDYLCGEKALDNYAEMKRLFAFLVKIHPDELIDTLVKALTNKNTPLSIAEVAYVLLYNITKNSKHFNRLNPKRLMENIYLRNLRSIPSDEIKLRLESFHRMKLFYDQVTNEYCYNEAIEEALVTEGMKRTKEDAEFAGLCSRIWTDKYDPNRGVSDR